MTDFKLGIIPSQDYKPLPKEQMQENKKVINAEADKKEAEDKAKRYKGQRNFWVVFLLIVVIAILGGVFLYMVNQDKFQSQVYQNSTCITNSTCINTCVATTCPAQTCNPSYNITIVNKYTNST